MDSAQEAAPNPAVELAKLRWRNSPVVRRAAETVVERWDELDAEHREQLRAVVTEKGTEQ